MGRDYEQMQLDTTLESDRSLKDNVQTIIKFALHQIMEYDRPEQVRNRHEGYGIAAEGYSALGQISRGSGSAGRWLRGSRKRRRNSRGGIRPWQAKMK